jgi:hypothetical protein
MDFIGLKSSLDNAPISYIDALIDQLIGDCPMDRRVDAHVART